MILNLLTDTRINKFFKYDNNIYLYSIDGINWNTSIPSIEPFFLENNINLTFDNNILNTKINDSILEKTYNLLIEENLLTFEEIIYDSRVKNFINIYNENSFQITIDNGILNTSSIIRTTESQNNFIYKNLTYEINLVNDTFSIIEIPILYNIFGIEFTDLHYIYDIKLDFTVESFHSITYQYSLDGKNYYDFEYFKIDVSSLDDNEFLVIEEYKDCIFKKQISNNKTFYSIYNNKAIPQNVYNVIVPIIESNNRIQIFNITENNETKYLYDTLNIKFLQIKIDGMISNIQPFNLLNLNVTSKKEFINLDLNYDITHISTHLYMPSYFNIYPFIPSMTNSFLKILSSDNKDV